MTNEYMNVLATVEELAETAIDNYSDWRDYNNLMELATEAMKAADKAEDGENVDISILQSYANELKETIEAIEEQIKEYPYLFEVQYSGSRFYRL